MVGTAIVATEVFQQTLKQIFHGKKLRILMTSNHTILFFCYIFIFSLIFFTYRSTLLKQPKSLTHPITDSLSHQNQLTCRRDHGTENTCVESFKR